MIILVLGPISRSIEQIGDKAFAGVLWRSAGWALACFFVLHAVAVWGVHQALALHGMGAWLADIVAAAGVWLLAFWLFIPVAIGIGTLYIERIALAVEQRFYPWLPAASGAPVLDQVWDGIAVGMRVLLLNVAALCVAALPVLGWAIGWLVGGYAIGRGLFVAVAMRRMARPQAERLYRRHRASILVNGCVLALIGYVPLLNLLLPVLGTAVMVHVLDMGSTQARRPTR